MLSQRHLQFTIRSSPVIAVLAALAFVVFEEFKTTATSSTIPKPGITITRVPPSGAGPDVMEVIAGTVRGVNAKKGRVVVFAHANTWYVQPYAASPYTSIGNDGKWETQTHLGTEYAALLVDASYKPPSTTDTLPVVGGPVLAVTKVSARIEPGRNSGSKGNDSTELTTIQFSGFTWEVKSSDGRMGPGPNYFSDSSSNVDVDSEGRLHLRITQRDGRWYCAEVISTQSFGYGRYAFYVDTAVESIDPRIVLGMFTWSDAAAYYHREIDIEISRWGRTSAENGQFVVQPYTRSTNIVHFRIPPELKRSTHTFQWEPDRVFCQSLRGFPDATPRGAAVIRQHEFTEGIPAAGSENVRINLWLMTGEPPTDGKEMEVVISRFEFVR